MQWLKWFINTGEVLLKIPPQRAQAPHYTWVRGRASAAEAQQPAICMPFGLKLSHSVQHKSEYIIYTVNFSEVLSDLGIMQLIKENFTHPMSLLLLMVACECMIALFAWQYK